MAKGCDGKENIIRKAIVRAVAFFDLFDYPLTAFEIWKYCSAKCELLEITDEVGKSFLQEKSGFYFLPGREEIVEVRKKRYNYSLRKLKRARLIAKIFKIIPWIKMIAAGNIIGSFNLKDGSDIDLFIITKKNKIWLTRFFCVLITKVLNLRPTQKNSRDKVCLSFFIDEDDLNLDKLMLKNKTDDIYFIYWLAGLVPIFNRDEIFVKLIFANSWLNNCLPNWQAGIFSDKLSAGKPWPKFCQQIINFAFGWLKDITKKIQLKKLPQNLKELMNKDTRVVINDNILKLHALDRRAEYQNLFGLNLLLVHFFETLPKFEDGRIDYSNSDIAPVITCVLNFQNKFLLLKRSDKVSAYRGKWNIIAGYLDDFRPFKEKVLEEIFEETGVEKNNILEMEIGEPVEIFDPEINKTWLSHSSIVTLKREPVIKLDWEHTEFAWIKPEEIEKYDIASGVKERLKILTSRKNRL
jgi:8-oxo-dGTP pyrophosphatase MutT (NUDIX family)